MEVLKIAAILVIGFVGSAEFGSAALVHPVIRRLEPEAQLTVEKGLPRTFGRVMPVAMTAATVLGIAVAIADPSAWTIAGAAVLGVALIVTIVGNVPINLRTGRLPEGRVPEGFIAMRRRWDVLQVVRASLQLAGFILIVVGTVPPSSH